MLRPAMVISLAAHLAILAASSGSLVRLAAPDAAARPGLLQVSLETAPAVASTPPVTARTSRPTPIPAPATTQIPRHTRTRPIAAAPPAARVAITPHRADEPRLNGVPVGATGDQTNVGARDRLLQLLREQLQAYFVYPALARKYGWEGRVYVDIELTADGDLKPLRVARTSGHSVLDQAALATLHRIGALPQARPWLQGQSVGLRLPVSYQLIEG